MYVQIGDSVNDFKFYRNAIETDLIQGKLSNKQTSKHTTLKKETKCLK